MARQVYDPTTDASADKYGPEIYKQRVASRNQLEQEVKSGGVVDKSGPIGEGVGEENLTQNEGPKAQGNYGAAAQMASQGASSGNAAGIASGGLMAYGAMSANPWLIGAGLGLQVLGQGEANKRQQQQAQREAYNQRIMQRQQIMQQIASQGIQ